jgi:hypothetical protein
MKIPPNPARINSWPGRIGVPPSAAKTGIPASNTLNSLNMLSNQRQIFASNCYSQSLFGRADASNTDYYVITRFPKHTTSTKQKLYAVAVLAEMDHTDLGTVTWYPNYAPGTLGTGYVLYSEAATTRYSTMYDGKKIEVKNRTKVLSHPDFTTTQIDASPEFEIGLLRFDHLLPVALGVFHMGPAGDAPADINVHPKRSDMSAGAAIRGREGSLYREGLGDLLFRTGYVSHTTDYLSSALGSPIFSFGVPCGIWVGSAAGGDDTHNIFGTSANLRCRVRSPYQTDHVRVRPTVVYSTGTADCTYTCTVTYAENGSGASSGELVANTPNPTLCDFDDPAGIYTPTNDLELDVDAESSVFIEVTLDGDLDDDAWIKIHSVVLWPEYILSI